MSSGGSCACRRSPEGDQGVLQPPPRRPPCCCESRCTCPHCHSRHSQRASHHHSHHRRTQESETCEVRRGGPRSARRCTSCLPEQVELGEVDLLARQLRCDEARATEQQRRAALAETVGYRGGPSFYPCNTAELLRRRSNVAQQAAVDAEYDARRRALQAELDARRGEIEAMRRSREDLRMTAARCESAAVERCCRGGPHRGGTCRARSAERHRFTSPQRHHGSVCQAAPPQEVASPPSPPPPTPPVQPEPPQAAKECPCTAPPHDCHPPTRGGHAPPPPPPPPQPVAVHHHHHHYGCEWGRATSARCAGRTSSPWQHGRRPPPPSCDWKGSAPPPPPPPPPRHHHHHRGHSRGASPSSCCDGKAPARPHNQPGTPCPRSARPCSPHPTRNSASCAASACPSCGQGLLSARDIVSLIAAGKLENSVACPTCGFIGGTLRWAEERRGASPPEQQAEAPTAKACGADEGDRRGRRACGALAGPWLRSSSAVGPASSFGPFTGPKFGRKVFITDDLHRDRRERNLAQWEAQGTVRRLPPSTRSPSAPLPERTPQWRTTGERRALPRQN